jgi:hypothetical protein
MALPGVYLFVFEESKMEIPGSYFLSAQQGGPMKTARVATLAGAVLVCVCTLASVPTQHNDAKRTGANLSETKLTTGSVSWSRFGHVATFPVDGDIYAQPLYLPRVATTKWGRRDLLLVATANNTLYAFDATASGNVAPLWKRPYGNAVPMPSDDFANLEATCQKYTANHGPGLPPESARIGFDNHVWYNMRQIGITGTPVVDTGTDTVYFATFSRDARPTTTGPCMDFKTCAMTAPCSHLVYTYHYWLHAVDVRSGDEKPRSPVEITGTAPGTSAGSINGVVTFQASRQLQRPALLLAKVPQPALYIAFGGRGDTGYYHGWVFAYDLGTPQKRLAVFLDEPDADASYPLKDGGAEDGGEQGGIWQSGQGPVADADGNVYLMSGNGSNTARNFGDSFIKLRLTNGALKVVKAWSPYPNERGDNDLGSSGPVLVDNGNLLVGGDKSGIIYLLSRDLALQQQFRAVIPPSGSSCDLNTYPRSCPIGFSANIHGSPVYWKGRLRTFLYVWGENDCLRAYPLDAGKVPLAANQCLDNPAIGAAASVSPDLTSRPPDVNNAMPGGMLALSARGDQEGSAIVWAVRPLSGTALQQVPPGVLEAFDATNVGRRLWATEQFAADRLGKFARFTPPTVAGGRVFMATFSNAVMVYGMLPAPRVAERGIVTALSRNSTDASLYRVGADGRVLSTWWDGQWHPWFAIGAQAGWAAPGAQVTPLSRTSSDASIYVTGNDGGVYSTWWSDGQWHDWFRIGNAFTVPKGAPIRALSRKADDASLYVVGSDGGVYSTWWSNGLWHDWFRIGNGFDVPPGSTVEVLSRDPSDASLYVVGNDGGIYSTWWSSGAWHNWFRIGNAFAVQKGSAIHALSRMSTDASLYVIGADGGVYSTWWSDGVWAPWFRIDRSFVASKGGHVMPLSRKSDDASLYLVGNDGSVYSTWWSNGAWAPWFRIDFATAVGGSMVTPLSRLAPDASLYLVGVDGLVHSTFWNGAWQPWFTVP